MLSDLAFTLAEDDGSSVRVITSRLNYDGAGTALPSHEVINRVTVHRVWSSRFGRSNLLGRAIDYGTFYGSAAVKLWQLTRRADIVVAKTDPPLISIIATLLTRLRGAKLINWLQDIFPEVAQELGWGKTMPSRAFISVLRWMRNRSLKGAAANVVLGRRMAEQLTGLGVPAARIHTIANWADGDTVTPLEHSANPLRQKWNLTNTFVVGYSGNLGRAHEIETMLEAIGIIEQDSSMAEDRTLATGATANSSLDSVNAPAKAARKSKIRWLFIGGGTLMDALKVQTEQRGLTSVVFKPYQPRDALAMSLSVPDLHLVSLRPELEGLILPSKIYGIAAAGRPFVFIGDAAGDVAELAETHVSGLTIEPGDSAALAQAILSLAENPAQGQAMGQRARAAFNAHFAQPIATAKWRALINATGTPIAEELHNSNPE